jgi:hypothetical protein
MNAKTWLRISAVVSLLLAIGHSLGGRKSWSPNGDLPVLQQMRDNHFDVMGVNRSFYDFYMAFGWSLSIALFMQSILMWQLGGLVTADVARARPMIAVITAAVVASAIIAWWMIFPVPAYFEAALSVCMIVALVRAR